MAFDLQGCDSAIIHYKIILNDAYNQNKQCQYEKLSFQGQIDTERSKNAVWVKDNEFLKSELHIVNKRVRLLKIGLFTVSVAGIIELGYIVIHK